MGIKHYSLFLKKHFAHYMHPMPKGATVPDLGIQIDNLMIDMNGVFHNSAQKIYEYGNYKPHSRLLGRRPPRGGGLQKQKEMFAHVCDTIELMFNIVQPKRRLVLCVDGPAPLAKQNQQRQRRFRSAQESGDNPTFETSSITPGTKFMDFLTKYIDWFIRKKITEDPKWQGIEIFFSNEKAPGEGEHKLINFIRNHGTREETYCINGLDADLFMLALGTHMPNFYILREDLYDARNEYHCIDVGAMRGDLSDLLYWESDTHEFSVQSAIDDFIAMCFMVGNDFLPHIPSIEIIEDGIDLMMNVYRQVGESHGHLTSNKSGKVLLLPHVLQVFLGTLGHHEKDNFEHKMGKKSSFFPDTLLESCSTQDENGDWDVDIEKYNEIYHKTNFPEGTDLKEMCHAYFEGMQWVLSYYTRGVPNWKWLFPYHYAPSASVLAKHIHTFRMPQYGHTVPTVPFQQLLCVLPPKCANLIPEPLNRLLLDENSPLKEYCPDTLEIDLSGKRREWEGIVILPMVDFDKVLKAYFSKIQLVDKRELRRNMLGKSFVYKYEPRFHNTFKSYYGDILECKVKTTIIEL